MRFKERCHLTMRAAYALVGMNLLFWSLPILASPKAHFTPIGSYEFWWFDNLPVASIALSALMLVALLSWGREQPGARRVTTVVAATMIGAFLPYACMSGGGV